MPLSRRAAALRPVISEKKELTWSLLSQNFSTAPADITLISGVEPASANLPEEVTIGTVVNWIFFEFNISPEAITNTQVIHWKIIKVPSGFSGVSAANTYQQDDRKWIIKRGMEMLPKNVNTIIKRMFVVRIPRKMRRIGEGDKIRLLLEGSASQTANFCGIAICKPLN